MKLRELTQENLGRLNSATKYPSIPTYHEMGGRGRLNEKLAVQFDPEDELVVTEKLDGTNVRVIMAPPHDYIIGSREELLYARGDLLANPQLGIVEGMQPVLHHIQQLSCFLPIPGDAIYVFYGELFGGKIGKQAKQYTSCGHVAFRLFDLGFLLPDRLEYVFKSDREQIARWRDHGGQSFYEAPVVADFCANAGIAKVPTLQAADQPPASVLGAYKWLRDVAPERSHACMDQDAPGHPEGVIVRTKDRRKIAKLRFEDYRRTVDVKGDQ